MVAPRRGIILNGKGEVALARARIISLEVVKALRDDEGMLPTAHDATMSAIYKKLLKDSPSTKLRQDRRVSKFQSLSWVYFTII